MCVCVWGGGGGGVKPVLIKLGLPSTQTSGTQVPEQSDLDPHYLLKIQSYYIALADSVASIHK